MKYLKIYEDFVPIRNSEPLQHINQIQVKPIKHNLAKKFKPKKNIDKAINYFQKRINSLHTRIPEEKDSIKRSKMNNLVNTQVRQLADLQRKKIRQVIQLSGNTIKESFETSGNLADIINSIMIGELEPAEIVKYVGFDESDYKIETYRGEWGEFDEKGISLLLKSDILENIINCENGAISYTINVANSNQSEYYVDDDEFNYIAQHLSGDTLQIIKELSVMFDYNINVYEEGAIYEFFNYLGLYDLLEDIKNEISMANERAIEKNANEIIKRIPFNIENTHRNNFDLDLSFSYSEMWDYMEKNNIDVKTISEFIENVTELNDISNDLEEGSYEYLDYSDINLCVYNEVVKYSDTPDDIFPILIKYDKLNIFKAKYKEYAFFDYEYDIWLGNRDRRERYADLFYIAAYYNNSVTEFMKTYKFQKEILDLVDDSERLNQYNKIVKSKMTNPKIEQEYNYLLSPEIYNI